MTTFPKNPVMHASPSSISRRDMIRALGGGLGAIGLANLLMPSAGASPVSRGPHFTPRAKRVIQLFMNGGPFGPDVLDPKPALNRFAGWPRLDSSDEMRHWILKLYCDENTSRPGLA